MKKLLSLLSVLTISGSVSPTVIANSPYKKEEKIENINYKQKRSNNENNKINIAKIVITANGIIRSSGIILNNKVYFGSYDNNVYEYNTVTKEQKTVIKTNGEVWTSGVVLNNKIYFGSDDHNVYEYDSATQQQKVVIQANNFIRSSGVVLNNKIYFGSTDHNVYEYDPVTEQQKTVIKTNDWIDSSGVVLNNKIYFGSADKNVYEYDSATQQQKVVIQANGVFFSRGIILNNKLYFGSWDHNVYEYDSATQQQKVVIQANGEIWTFGVILNNKLYFGSDDHKVYEYDPVTEQQKVVIEAVDNSPNINNNIRSSGVVLNNKLYFGCSNSRVYEYDPTTGQQKTVIKTNGWIDSGGVVLNNKLYFGSADGNVYEYSEYYNLGQINDNSDIVILNELNYLIPELDILQLEIINKTNNSATLKIKDNLNKNINIEIKFSIDNEQNKIFNLNELIKKSIFFKFQDENSSLKFKEINYIDNNNLNFGNIEVKRNSELLHIVDFKDACFSKKTFINFSSKDKQNNIPKCEYNTKSRLVFQITKGISKGVQEIEKNGWIINLDDEIKLSDFININNKDSEIINTLSENFDLSNTNKQEQEIILQPFNEDDYEISIDPKTKLEVIYSVREINLETILNLKQKIRGNISVKIIDNNNEEKIITLSIKEAMQILQKYSLLSDEITINEDNSITFNGKAKISLTQESEPKLVTKISQI